MFSLITQNPKILDKVEESCAQCRKLILKLATDSTYKSLYMSQQFSNDMEKMMIESVILIKEVISNLSSSAGCTVIEKVIYLLNCLYLNGYKKMFYIWKTLIKPFSVM